MFIFLASTSGQGQGASTLYLVGTSFRAALESGRSFGTRFPHPSLWSGDARARGVRRQDQRRTGPIPAAQAQVPIYVAGLLAGRRNTMCPLHPVARNAAQCYGARPNTAPPGGSACPSAHLRPPFLATSVNRSGHPRNRAHRILSYRFCRFNKGAYHPIDRRTGRTRERVSGPLGCPRSAPVMQMRGQFPLIMRSTVGRCSN